jgi:hypothetical protein
MPFFAIRKKGDGRIKGNSKTSIHCKVGAVHGGQIFIPVTTERANKTHNKCRELVLKRTIQ